MKDPGVNPVLAAKENVVSTSLTLEDLEGAAAGQPPPLTSISIFYCARPANNIMIYSLLNLEWEKDNQRIRRKAMAWKQGTKA